MPPPSADALIELAKTSDPSRSMPANALLHSDLTTLPNSATTTATTANVVHQHCVAADLENLETLLRSKHALPVLMALKAASDEVVDMIQCEMEATEGKTWLIFVGFHRSESMRHVHLHIISSDFESEGLKTKKHYNSFSPKSGFFISLESAISWVKNKTPFSRPSDTKRYFDAPLKSFRTGEVYPNMPALKRALDAEFKQILERTKPAGSTPEPASARSAPAAASTSKAADYDSDATIDSQATLSD